MKFTISWGAIMISTRTPATLRFLALRELPEKIGPWGEIFSRR